MNPTSSQDNLYSDDERGLVDILQSMGITQFDPMVPVALNEYARSKKSIICFEFDIHSSRR